MSGPRKRILLATRNPGKAREVRAILKDLPVEIVTLRETAESPQVEEDGRTFEENALKKARTLARWWNGMVLADDSGLEVDVLDGAPGVRSARYAGDDATDAEHNRKLLKELQGVAQERRTARFRCVLALVVPEGCEWVVEGACDGLIAREMRGEGGFGYDPLFLVPGLGLTFAEVAPEVKNRISHRARALARLRTVLQEILSAQDEWESRKEP
jgi:XTP/dITP diphosphohydrolase